MGTLDSIDFKKIWNLDTKCVLPSFFENQLKWNDTVGFEGKVNKSIDYIKRILQLKDVFQADMLLNILIQKNNTAEIKSLYNLSAKDATDAYLAILYSLYGGLIPINASNKCDFSFKVNEKVILSLFLCYLKELIEEKKSDGQNFKNFFQLENSEKFFVQKVAKEMENWFQNLESIEKFQSLKEELKKEKLHEYALNVKERINLLEVNSSYIIPNGLPFNLMEAGVAIVSKNSEGNRK